MEDLAGWVSILRTNFSENFAFFSGAAIYFSNLKENSEISIENCVFVENSANKSGGAIFVSDISGEFSVFASDFSGNFAFGFGAAIYLITVSASSGVLIENCTFLENNVFKSGGAVYLEELEGKVSFLRSGFSGKIAGGFGAAIFLITSAANSNFSVDSCTFEKNGARKNGGAVYFEALEGKFSFQRSNFSENFALGFGAAVYLITAKQNSVVFIENCMFMRNNANKGGGAVYLEAVDGNLSFLRSNFSENVVPGFGAAIYFTNNSNLSS